MRERLCLLSHQSQTHLVGILQIFGALYQVSSKLLFPHGDLPLNTHRHPRAQAHTLRHIHTHMQTLYTQLNHLLGPGRSPNIHLWNRGLWKVRCQGKNPEKFSNTEQSGMPVLGQKCLRPTFFHHLSLPREHPGNAHPHPQYKAHFFLPAQSVPSFSKS